MPVADLRRKILDASVTLVEEQGVRAVSFREVARRAGVSHQAPYHHFGNHHGILRAIADEGFTQLARLMQEAAERAGPDPLIALSAAGVAYAEFARQHPGHFRVMFQHNLVDIHDADDPLESAGETHGTLVRLTEAAHTDGYGTHMPVEILTNLCWSTVHGIAVLLVEGALVSKELMSDTEQSVLIEHVIDGFAGLLQKDRSKRKTRSKKHSVGKSK